MGHIDVTKNTVVKSTSETFELIKALFKANGATGEPLRLPDMFIGTDGANVVRAGKDTGDTEITLQELAFDSLAAPEWATMIVKFADGKYVWLKHNKKGLGTMVKHLDGTCESESGPAHKWSPAEVIMQKQKTQTEKQQPTNYRKIAPTEPWEIVKRWQEDGDLYAHLYAQHSMSIGGFAKIRHIQQLAQLISQDRVYERCSEFELFAERFKGIDSARAAFDAGLRFTEDWRVSMIEELIIEHQQQTEPKNCVSTCLAMITGQPVGVVTRQFHEPYMDGEIEPWDFLKSKGIDFKRCLAAERQLKPNKVYLVTVPSLNMTGHTHQVVFQVAPCGGGWLLDPNEGRKGKLFYTMTDEQAMGNDNAFGLKSWAPDVEIDTAELLRWREGQSNKADGTQKEQ